MQLDVLETRVVPTLWAAGTAFAAFENQSFSGNVGSFTVQSGTAVHDYTATILWGDGSSSTGTINSFAGVSGTHTYKAAGTYAVAFQVVDSHASLSQVGITLALKASVAATSEYGTARANGTWLLELALNMKSPTVYDPDPDDPDIAMASASAPSPSCFIIPGVRSARFWRCRSPKRISGSIRRRRFSIRSSRASTRS